MRLWDSVVGTRSLAHSGVTYSGVRATAWHFWREKRSGVRNLARGSTLCRVLSADTTTRSIQNGKLACMFSFVGFGRVVKLLVSTRKHVHFWKWSRNARVGRRRFSIAFFKKFYFVLRKFPKFYFVPSSGRWHREASAIITPKEYPQTPLIEI